MSPASTSFIMPLMAPAASLAIAPSPATWTMPSSSTEMLTPNWSCSALMVLPPGPMSIPIFSFGMRSTSTRGANSETSARGSAMAPSRVSRVSGRATLGRPGASAPRAAPGDRAGVRARRGDGAEQDVQDLEPAHLGLAEGLLQELGRDARDLHVHLKRRDAVPRTGDLEVHVAHVVLEALNVRQDDVVLTLLDEAHRHTRDRRLYRHAAVHERQRRAADARHRGGAVRLEHLGDDAQGVGELLVTRDHRKERALGERPGADRSAPRR